MGATFVEGGGGAIWGCTIMARGYYYNTAVSRSFFVSSKSSSDIQTEETTQDSSDANELPVQLLSWYEQ